MSEHKPVSVRDLHEHFTRDTIRDRGGPTQRDDMFGRGLWFGGLTRTGRRWLTLRKRGYALAEEHTPPIGQAGAWYEDVIRSVSRSGREVAKQLARLCVDDSQVTIPWRSLADAVGKRNRAGNLRSYTERGVRVLVEAGWLRVETVGQKRGARTTFYLLPGDPAAAWEQDWLDDDEDILDVA